MAVENEEIDRSNSEISVIVPFHGKIIDIALCLQALAKTAPAPREVIVVLDGHAPGVAEVIEEMGVKLIQIDSPSPRGPLR